MSNQSRITAGFSGGWCGFFCGLRGCGMFLLSNLAKPARIVQNFQITSSIPNFHQNLCTFSFIVARRRATFALCGAIYGRTFFNRFRKPSEIPAVRRQIAGHFEPFCESSEIPRIHRKTYRKRIRRGEPCSFAAERSES